KTTSAFFVDPKTKTGKGPWKSSMAYYGDLKDSFYLVNRDFGAHKLLADEAF
ncbi:hypothetical protein FOC1_g10006490, partial [Fusarium oxysporum f. sp. cubense race 1]